MKISFKPPELFTDLLTAGVIWLALHGWTRVLLPSNFSLPTSALLALIVMACLMRVRRLGLKLPNSRAGRSALWAAFFVFHSGLGLMIPFGDDRTISVVGTSAAVTLGMYLWLVVFRDRDQPSPDAEAGGRHGELR